MKKVNEGKKLNACFSGVMIYWNGGVEQCKRQFIEDLVPSEMEKMGIKKYTIKRTVAKRIGYGEICLGKLCDTIETHINVSAYIYES